VSCAGCCGCSLLPALLPSCIAGAGASSTVASIVYATRFVWLKNIRVCCQMLMDDSLNSSACRLT
jgi:hypothetical protein